MALSDLKIKLSYTSQGEDDILKDFLIPALKEATLYKRSVGFFSSSVFELLGEGLDSLVKNDGEIRIICSPELSKEDIEGIQLGYALKEGILRNLFEEDIENTLSEIDDHNLIQLISLIAKDKLNVMVVDLDNSRGEIEFEHEDEKYLVRREWEYYKQRSEDIIHRQDADSFYVQKKTSTGDWKELEDPEALIEEVLPSGLAPYFFFDGETMIADLKIRGTDSAKTLKKALHSIFELELYENALRDIGSIKTGQSALGQLESRRLAAYEKAAKAAKTRTYIKEIRILSDKIEIIDEENGEFEKRILEYTKKLQEISESIGTSKSKKELENSRRLLQKGISDSNDDIKRIMARFGKELEERYAYLLITAVVKDAEKRLYLQVQDEEKRIIPGLTKELLINLLKDGENCLCGHKLDADMRSHLEEWKGFFPPASYKSTYDKFKRNAARFSRQYDADALLVYLLASRYG